MLKFLIGFLLLVFSLQQRTLTVNTTVINQMANYIITLNMSTSTVPQGSYLTFQFPSRYYSASNTNSVTCTNCTGAGTLILTFNNLTSVSGSVTLTIDGIKNPSAAGNPQFIWTFYSATTNNPI